MREIYLAATFVLFGLFSSIPVSAATTTDLRLDTVKQQECSSQVGGGPLVLAQGNSCIKACASARTNCISGCGEEGLCGAQTWNVEGCRERITKCKDKCEPAYQACKDGC